MSESPGIMEVVGIGTKREKKISLRVRQRLCLDNRDLRQLGVGRTKLIRDMMIPEWGHLEGRTLHHQQEERESTEAQAGDVASSWEAAGWKLENLKSWGATCM